MADKFAFRSRPPFDSECRNFARYMHREQKRCFGYKLCTSSISEYEASAVNKALGTDQNRLQLLRLAKKCPKASDGQTKVVSEISEEGFTMCFTIPAGTFTQHSLEFERIESLIDGVYVGESTEDACRPWLSKGSRKRRQSESRHRRSVNDTTTEPPTAADSSDFIEFRSNSTSSDEVCQSGTLNGAGQNVSAVCTECGNGVAEKLSDGVEQCDDNNTVSGDGCSSNCTMETGYDCTAEEGELSVCYAKSCGDGIRVGGEDCDTGGAIGCENVTCTVSVGFSCVTPAYGLSTCSAVCGDGLVVGSEECDDTNTASGDGCSSSCAVEIGYNCSSSFANGTSICELKDGFNCTGGCSLCGNGIRELPEECDDGNIDNLDGCNSVCQVEELFDCTTPIGDLSTCVHYAVDLDRKDNTTLNHVIWYTRQKEFVFLVDPELIDASRIGDGVWARKKIVTV